VRGVLGSKAPGTVFRGGEGLWYFNGIVYFSTKGDNRIWAFEPATQQLQVIYDFATASPADRVLSGVDNLTVSRHGDVLVAEDGGNMELCVILPDRRVKVLLRVHGQDASEITGPAFSPDGTRLYFNSQRGGRQGAGLGITYEVKLPA
jgi:secreted PhoX family phosphatase